MAENDLLLDLSTSRFQAHVKIEDEGKTKSYGLLKWKWLGLIQQTTIREIGSTLSGIGNIKTQADEDQCNDDLLKLLCIIIPEAGKALLAKLPIVLKVDTVTKYFEVSGLLKKKAIQRKKKKSKRKGHK